MLQFKGPCVNLKNLTFETLDPHVWLAYAVAISPTEVYFPGILTHVRELYTSPKPIFLHKID